MAGVDDWGPIPQQQKPADDWAPVKPAAPDATDYLGASQSMLPQAFVDRVVHGHAIQNILNKAAGDYKSALGDEPVTGLTPENVDYARSIGLFHDPHKTWGPASGIQLVNEAAIMPTAKAFETIMRAANAGLHGAGAALGQLVEELGDSQGAGERAKREVINAGNWLLVESGFGRFSRPSVTTATEKPWRTVNQWFSEDIIGKLPTELDFKYGADVIAKGVKEHPKYAMSGPVAGSESAIEAEVAKRKQTDALYQNAETPAAIQVHEQRIRAAVTAEHVSDVEENLRQLWQEKGIHPAEAVHDAEFNAFLKHDLSAPPAERTFTTEETVNYDRIMNGQAEGDVPLRALGAEVTDPPLISPAEQPSPPSGRLGAAIRSLGEKILDLGRDAMMLVSPMTRGSGESRAIAKDFSNTLRRNRWEHARIDADIEKRFTPEQRKRMWDAADEESVLRQEGKTSEHMGLATLTAEERAAVEELHAHAQSAWLRAVDIGLVEGEGLPAYTPRMVVNAAGGATGEGAGISLNGIGYNLHTNSRNLMRRKYLTAEETEAAAKAAMGEGAELVRDIRALPLATARLEDAIAGRTLINQIKEYGAHTGAETVVEGAIPAGADAGKFFSMSEHPAFWTWRPKLEKVATTDEAGNAITKFQALKDEAGNTIFEKVPIFVANDFEGPLKAVLSQKNGPIYSALMSLKGKTMGLIMNSPMIHNAVEWGRAMPAMPGKVVTFRVYFDGNRLKNDVAQMTEAINGGLVPIGKRFFNQDVSSLIETPDLTPGRSWTAKVLGFVPGLFDEGAGVAVKRAVDKAGDFWHNTLLWDRVADLQAGLYKNFRDDMLAKGVDRQTAVRVAAHFANRFAGSLPEEAMSNMARKISNFVMFSRTFTLGNLGVMKDMLTGLPKDVIAQIERDMGVIDPKAAGYAKSMARRKAAVTVGIDIAMMYAGNAILQSAINVMWGDSTLDKEMHGYVERAKDALTQTAEHPMKLLQPFNFLQSLSPTEENEPRRQERVKVGYSKDGTAIYARNPVGKIGEEFTGWLTGPLDMMRRKMGTIARPLWQIMANDKGFGRKIYDPDADTPGKYLANMGQIARHLIEAQTPVGQIQAAADLVKGEGDTKLNLLQMFGPFAGVTFSKGAPGGPAVGEMYHERAQHDYQVQLALPDIRKQIQRGDVQGATQKMTELGIPRGLQNFYIRTSINPATRLSPRALRDFYQRATPEQRQRLDRSMQQQPTGPMAPAQ